MRTAIGVGSYGCVYRPSYKCEKKHPPNGYENTISKLMLNLHSETEMNEYNKIVKIDKKNAFFLGKPYVCNPNQDEILATVDPDDCDIFNPDDVKNYKLLISKDGGMDLDDFFEKKGFEDYIKKFKTPKMAAYNFLLKMHNLFLGLKLFNENDITHFDIKPSNIVFNIKTQEFKFIDFGLMDNISDVKSNINAGTQKANIHWSYPLEFGFLKHDSYFSYSNLNTQSDVNNAIQILQNLFSEQQSSSITQNLSQTYKNEIQKIKDKSRGFSNTFIYMNDLLNPFTNSDKMAMISSTVNSVYAYKDKYDELLDKIVNTMDSYAMGFTLNHIINEFKTRNLLSDKEYSEMHMFCSQLFDFNVEARLRDYNMILVKYEEILEKTDILAKLNVRFENNKVVKGSIVSKTKNPNKTALTSKKINKTLDISLEKKDLINCPAGKEFNSVTRRCVKICAPGKTRNEKGRCVSIKKRMKKNKSFKFGII